MGKYISIGNRKTYRSGTSIALALPSTVLKKNNVEVGDEVEVLWDGENDMLIRFAKKEK